MTYAKATLGNDNFPTDIEEQKVLGLSWNFHNDEFVIKLMSLAQLAGELSLTKRNIGSGLSQKCLTLWDLSLQLS